TVPGAQTVNEDTDLLIPGISVADVDAGSASNFVVTLSVLHGTLTLRTDVSGGLTASDLVGNGTGTVTATATLAKINATLANATGVTYRAVQDYNGSDTLTVLANDNGNTGSGGALTDTKTVA